MSIVAAFIVLLSAGLFLYFDPMDLFDRDPSSEISGGRGRPDGDQQSPEPTATPTAEPIRTVDNITIMHMGASVTELDMEIGDEAIMHLTLVPHVENARIDWTSSDRQVFTVTPTGTSGTEARVTAVSAGVATLTVRSGNTVKECFIIVWEEEVTDYLADQLREFFENINNTNVGVSITTYWIDGPHEGKESVYFRERNSTSWKIRRVNDTIDDIDPEFSYSYGLLTISWPVMSYNRTHYIFDDGTGYFSRDYRSATSVYENLVWEIVIG